MSTGFSPEIQAMIMNAFPELADEQSTEEVIQEREAETIEVEAVDITDISEEMDFRTYTDNLLAITGINELSSFGDQVLENNEETSYNEVSLEEIQEIAESIIETPTPYITNQEGEKQINKAIEEELITKTKETQEEVVSARFSRFKGADWFDIVQQQEVILAGLGGIGSYVSLLLSRLNPKELYLFDDDSFESHNLSGQFVTNDDIGEYKVTVALQKAIEYSGYTPSIYSTKYEGTDLIKKPIMICGFDNMKARKEYYNAWKSQLQGTENKEEYVFIDGRLLAEEYQILVIPGDDEFIQKEYEEEFLFSDNDIEEVDCTLRQTSHIASLIGAKMVTYFVNFCNNLSEDNFPRRIPYFTHYNALMNSYEFRY